MSAFPFRQSGALKVGACVLCVLCMQSSGYWTACRGDRETAEGCGVVCPPFAPGRRDYAITRLRDYAGWRSSNASGWNIGLCENPRNCGGLGKISNYDVSLTVWIACSDSERGDDPYLGPKRNSDIPTRVFCVSCAPNRSLCSGRGRGGLDSACRGASSPGRD